MTTHKSLLALLLAAFALPALADDTGVAPPSEGAPVQIQKRADGGTVIHYDTMTTSHGGARVFGMNTVKNAPYSAQAVNEREQNLGDGNQISQRRDSATWYRDSAGRTRLETRDAQGELRNVVINDPVAGAAWTLDPRKRTALKVAIRGRLPEDVKREAIEASNAGEAARARADALRARIEGRRAEAGEQAVIVKRVERGQGMPTAIGIRLPALVGADGRLSGDMAPLGMALANALNDAQWRKNTVTRDLGTKNVDGVKAEGKLRSYEIPAGAIGNRNPIVVADETWYAPELQVTVYAKHSDPRSGDTVFRLENIKREEPAAALFGVPADYTVRDALARTPDAG
jgi:hypothetical protein